MSNRVELMYRSTTYSQPSLSAMAIMPRAMTGRASDVPRRYTFCIAFSTTIRIAMVGCTDLIDAIRLDGGVNEFCHEFPFEILRGDQSTLISLSNTITWFLLRTSRKNFLAPTARAFFRAASKSYSKDVSTSVGELCHALTSS